MVVDVLYSWSDYKILREKYKDSMHVVAVYSPPELMYKRLENRAAEKDPNQRFRSSSKEESSPLLIIRTSTFFASQIAKTSSAPKRRSLSL